ncbi:baseplate assembly protein [Pseudomonas helleri]|uniref:baseplate assembly protein n=1 Tax=Pseudomonas helleri TaxID=1608996 RepID=UPI001296D77A|nr:baseplate assembly protein [Pseudomonas helleri]MQT34869.1 baseplate assembly protein [Pseudomonas helleri]
MSGLIDLSQLPEPNVIEVVDYELILADRKERFVSLNPIEKQEAVRATLGLESEPIVKMLQENAYREMLLRQRINESALAVMLAFSNDGDLDQLAANFHLERLELDKGNPLAVPPVPPTMESNDDLRARCQMAFEGLSVAGPRGAYIYHALSADGQVSDVSAESPAPCEVVVSVLSREGKGTASPALLAKVTAALSDEDIRPLGDRLTVQSVTIVEYAVEAILYYYPGPESEPIRAAAEKRLQAYIGNQRRIGRDIRRSALYAALHVEGVQRVELVHPVMDIVLNKEQAGFCTGYTLTVGGSDE